MSFCLQKILRSLAMPSIKEQFGRRFHTLDDAVEALNEAAKKDGQSLAVARKKPDATKPLVAIFRCSKGRTFKSQAGLETHSSRRRKTSTQMTSCPYRVTIERQSLESPWIILGNSTDHNATHNHELFAPEAFCTIPDHNHSKEKG